MPELLQSCIQRQQVATCRTTHRVLLAPRLELEQALRARKRGRAMGESGLPGELFALAHAQMASMCCSHFSHSHFFYVHEPFQIKGSQLCTFYKGRGVQTAVASQRGINLSDDAGKAFHHAIANKFMLLLLFNEIVNADADQVVDVTLLPILFGCLLLVHNGWDFIGQPCWPMLRRLSIRLFASAGLVTCIRMSRLLPCCADSGLMLLTFTICVLS